MLVGALFLAVAGAVGGALFLAGTFMALLVLRRFELATALERAFADGAAGVG